MSYIKIFYIFLLLFISGTTNVFAVNLYNWDIPPISPVDYYESIYMSPDSSVIVASGPNRSDRYSHDLGNVWTISTGVSAGVKKYASNYDGSILLSVKSGEKIKISTDKGITFTEISDSPIKDWRGGIAVSEDGQKIVAAAYGENIWVSSDAGNTWSNKTTPISDGGTNRWYDIDLASNTGDYIIVGAGITGGSVWISPDFGESWTDVGSLGLRDWRAVKVSPDGQDVYAAANNNHIYKSTNSGQDWDPITPNTGSLTAFDVTSTGSAMVASRQSDVYVSIDNGQNWNVESVGISQPINSVSISEDRKNIFLGRGGTYGRMSRGSLILSNYTLTTTSTNGSVTKNPNLAEYEEGSDITLTAVPDEGYQFVEWVGGCVGMGAECTFVMNENKSITANFELITYTISYDANTAISGTVPSNQTKTYGVDITIASNSGTLTKTGYTFTGWNTQPDGSGVMYAINDVYNINLDTTLYAQWEINQYALNAVSLNGSVTKNLNLAEYNHGTELTLTAVPDEGYQFVEWTGDCLGTDLECVLTIDTEKNVEAIFELIPSARRSGSVGVIGQLGIQMQPLQTPTLPTTIPGLQALVAQLQAQLQQLISQTPTQSQVPLQNSFTRDLEIGTEGNDVTRLQNLLISRGYIIPSGATGYFGPQTQSALINFQQANNITPAVGYFGPITRTVLIN